MSKEKNKINYSQLSKEQQKKLRSNRRKGNIIKAFINLPQFIGSKAGKAIAAGNVAESIIPKGEGKRVTKENLKKLFDAIKTKGKSVTETINKRKVVELEDKDKTTDNTKKEPVVKKEIKKKPVVKKETEKKPVVKDSKFAENLKKQNLATMEKNLSKITKSNKFLNKKKSPFKLAEMKSLKLKRTTPTLKRK